MRVLRALVEPTAPEEWAIVVGPLVVGAGFFIASAMFTMKRFGLFEGSCNAHQELPIRDFRGAMAPGETVVCPCCAVSKNYYRHF